jgi:hypothetical protein
MAIEREITSDGRQVVASYKGNPNDKPIYPKEIDHGYDEPIAGGTDVMQQLQKDLLKEQGNKKKASGNKEHKECLSYLDANLVKFPKKSGWWLPARNCAVSLEQDTLKLWSFTSLTSFPQRRSYVPQGENPLLEPAGLRMSLNWTPNVQNPEEYPTTQKAAELIVSLINNHKTIGETVREELGWLEAKTRIQIPTEIKSYYILNSPKIAVNRWEFDSLHTHDLFVPFDGRKSIPMPSFGRPKLATALENSVALRYLQRR